MTPEDQDRVASEQDQYPVEEPELPVAVAHISDPDAFDAYEVIPVYTAAQMHEHYQAGARAGAAGSQDGLSQVISGAIFDFAGYLTTRPNVIEVGSTANASPVADLVKEWAALRGLSLDDAAVLSWQEWLNAAMQGDKQ